MASHTSNSFHDGQLHAKLPDATAVYDIEQSSDIPEGTAHVDWAWDEPTVHFLCELKDPESIYGLKDWDGSKKIKEKLNEIWYLYYLANKAYQTADHHSPSSQNPKSYVVVVAIESLTAPDMDAAGLGLTKEMRNLGMTATGLVVNLAEWNLKLVPRTMQRV